jgi:hypothetical protein
MAKKLSFVLLILAILLIVVSIRSASPPAVKTGNVPDSSFSVKRAYTHLAQIARLPHSTGTAENARVRDYITGVCKQAGFSVQIQSTVSTINWGQHINAAAINNIIAFKKGQHNSKAVILMSHYDSEPNAPGAGDDGAGAAAMLETANALQKTMPLQNDLILLFTDGEEIGLMGANAFLKDSSIVNKTGVLINFEGRGNAGPSNMFEVNSENGWVINEYAKSVAHPFANSLGYEIYKKLPNGTDFSPFKEAGITGLNNAYIDGFVNYHSPTDKPKNMDQRSLQHQGDNMLSLAKHFGNLNITATKAPDASYFNVIGSWFVHYPASWNLIFVTLVDLLFVLFLVAGIRNKQIKIGGFVIGTLLFPVVLAIIYFAARYLLKFILSRYPMYAHFDGNNSYNSGWYFLAMSALAVTIFSFIYNLAAKKISFNSLLAGILLIALLFMNGMQYVIPSASYLLFIPLLFILAERFVAFRKMHAVAPKTAQLNWLSLVGVVPAILFLAPTVNSTFIAFALGENMPLVVIAVGLFTGLLLPVFYPAFKNQQALIPLTALLCLVGALLGGHLSSGYSQQHPLQSYLRYTLDADSAKANWLSDFKTTDKFTAGFFKAGGRSKSEKGYRGLVSDAPVLPLPPPVAVVVKDTSSNVFRTVVVHISAARENAHYININISDRNTVTGVTIDGNRHIISGKGSNTSFKSIGYTGITSNGFDVVFEMEAGKKLQIVVSDRSIGLPVVPGFNTTYPPDIVPARGTNVNTIQVSKSFVF